MRSNLKKKFYNLIFLTILFLCSFCFFMISYNFIVKKKYVYNIDNFYHGIPESIESYQNEDQKKISKIIRIENDEYGFRNSKKSINEKKILFLGDSLIRGMNTDKEMLLSNIVNKEIYNAGMDGFSTFNSVSVAKFLLKKKKFKKIVLFFTMNNDFRDNVFQSRYEKNFKSKLIIFIKNNQFLNQLSKLRFIFLNKRYKKNKKLEISEINKPYFGINYLKLLIEDKKFIDQTKIETTLAFEALKELSIESNAELLIIGVPDVSEIFKDFTKIPNITNELKIENLKLENFKSKINYENPRKIFFSICKKTKVKCEYVPLDEKSFYELDSGHWNDHGQQIAKDFLVNDLKF